MGLTVAPHTTPVGNLKKSTNCCGDGRDSILRQLRTKKSRGDIKLSVSFYVAPRRNFRRQLHYGSEQRRVLGRGFSIGILEHPHGFNPQQLAVSAPTGTIYLDGEEQTHGGENAEPGHALFPSHGITAANVPGSGFGKMALGATQWGHRI